MLNRLFPADLFRIWLFASLFLVAAAPAQATRGILIDVNTFEVWGDGGNGQVMPLYFPVNYGSGLQRDVTLNIAQGYDNSGLATVGLTFTNSPSDSLFAMVEQGSDFFETVPAVSISNPAQQSTPYRTVAYGSNFNFGTILNADMPPGGDCPPTHFCSVYGPLATGANFQFINLASSGTEGDFLLNITCSSFPCASIGFSLAGENFSSATFDPANPPSNLLSYSNNDGSASWSFIFRNPASVPEPNTWAMMLVGFGAIGFAMRRRRFRRLVPQTA